MRKTPKTWCRKCLSRCGTGGRICTRTTIWKPGACDWSKTFFLDKIKSKQYQSTQYAEAYEAPTEGYNPYQATELNDTMQKINRLMEALPPKQQQIIHLRDVEGYSYQEIAEVLEIDMNQVKVNLFRARASLKKGLLNAEAYGMD